MKRRQDIIMENALKNVKNHKANEPEEQPDCKMKENWSLNSPDNVNFPKEKTDSGKCFVIKQIDLESQDSKIKNQKENLNPNSAVTEESLIKTANSGNIAFNNKNELKSSISNDMIENFSSNSSSFIENSPECTQTNSSDIFNFSHYIKTQLNDTSDNESILNRDTLTRRPIQEKRVSSSSCNSTSSSRSSSSSSSSSSTSSSSSSSSSSASSNAQNVKSNGITSHFNTDDATTSQASTRSGRAILKSNYCVSPVNAPESDPDLSDNDPTFQDPNEISTHLRSLSSSSTDSILQPETPQNEIQYPETSNANESNTTQRKSRKRQRNPALWKQNICKALRNTGQSYNSLSKSRKEVPARCIKNPCAPCRLKCPHQINEVQRTAIFQSYWNLASMALKRSFISSSMMQIKPKYKYTNAERPRAPNNAFFFTVNNQKIRVCKTFFINTLDITERQIRTTKEKTNENGFIAEDKRGKHTNRKRIDETIIKDIENHINSIPRVESHYLRASTSREFIEGGRTVRDLWRDFSEARDPSKPKVDYWLYNQIFNKNFNLGFFQPKKDRCDLCLEYEMASVEHKTKLKEKFDTHLKEKDLCRLEKKNDRRNIGEGNICIVYDLQAVMQCPLGESSSFYYISKLNCLNFTMAELAKKCDKKTNKGQEVEGNEGEDRIEEETVGAYGDVYNYFWDEKQGKRGANEIGSCIFEYLKNVSEKYPNKQLNIIFYSDNCCGQNKNRFISCLYSYIVSNFPNIMSITHKFLIRGHTQNEGYNVHSLIEKEVKKNLKSGPIYTSHQYVALIKSAKKSGKLFKVQELNYDFFLDLKSLQDQWGYNFNEDDERNQVSWNDIKVLRFLKDEPFMIFFKTSYTQQNFKRVNMRNKRKRMPNLEDVSIPKAYTNKIKLSENKRKGLRELLRKNLIPGFYIDYYKSLLDD